jgi:outer membrane cobalamin receptor
MRQAVFSIFILLCLQGLAQSGQDQKKDSISTITLESITITHSGASLSQQDLNGKDRQTGTETNLSNALDHLPGVFKIHEAGYPLVYRGMTANRLRIERNGTLRTGVVDQGYLTDDINPGTVGSIRVVRGIESTLFGSGAIGGVIQINETPFSQLSNSGSLYLSYGSNHGGTNLGADLSRKSELNGFRLAARTSNLGNFKFGNGETAENSEQDQKNLNLALFKRNKSNTHQLTVSANYSNSDTERPQGFQNNPFELRRYRNRYTSQVNIASQLAMKSGAVLKQNLWGLWLETDQEFRSFNGDFSALNVFENRNYDKSAFGYRGTLALQPRRNISLQLGADFIGSRLDQKNVRDDYISDNYGITSFEQKRTGQMAGVFGLAEYKFDKAILGLSLRADLATIGTGEQSEQFQALTGGLELTLGRNPELNNTFSFTRKFRYPSQLESVGVLFGGRGVFYGNPAIKPEFGYQLEWTQLRRLNNQLNWSLSGWLALFENRIAEFPLGNSEFTYRNLDQARTFGLEMRVDYSFPGADEYSVSTLSLSTTITQGDDLEGDGLFSKGTPLLGIPPGRVRLSSLHKTQLSQRATLKATGNLDYIFAYNRLPSGTIRQTFGVMETESYLLADLNLSLGYQFNKNTIDFGLNLTNLTNSAYFPFGARIMGMGRNFTVILRYSF